MMHSGKESTEPAQSGGPILPELVRLTEEMFPGSPVNIEVEADPEEPESPFVVVSVHSRESAKQIVARQAVWHERISHLQSESATSLRLCVYPE